MSEPGELKLDEKRVIGAIEQVRKDPFFDPLFNLRSVTGSNLRVGPRILKKMVMDGSSVTYHGEAGMGKTTMLTLTRLAYENVCKSLRLDPSTSTNLWDNAKDEAIRKVGPQHTWPNYEPPNKIQIEGIQASMGKRQINEVVAKGYGQGLWDAGSSVLDWTVNNIDNMIYVGIPQEEGMQRLTDRTRETIRHAPIDQNIVQILRDNNIILRSASPTDEWDHAMREWARKSGRETHMRLKRSEETEIIDSDLDQIHHDVKRAPLMKNGLMMPKEYFQINVPPEYLNFLKFLGITDLETVETMVGNLRVNAAMILRRMRGNGVANNSFVVFNIPVPEPDGSLIIPPPVSI
ncbi:MAG TPA: hypothetical protein VG917_06145 [Patescibacteria group bacterium]|nr:hypothetical protein [Patescibacteria group bacterium]